MVTKRVRFPLVLGDRLAPGGWSRLPRGVLAIPVSLRALGARAELPLHVFDVRLNPRAKFTMKRGVISVTHRRTPAGAIL